MPSCRGNKVSLRSQEGSCGPPLLRHRREEKLSLVTTYRGGKSVLREGMTCARSYTKKWHPQDFNQVRLPRADFAEGSCWARVSRLQWAWVMLTLWPTHLFFHPMSGILLQEGASRPVLYQHETGHLDAKPAGNTGISVWPGKVLFSSTKIPRAAHKGSRGCGEGFWLYGFGEVAGSRRPMINTGAPGTAAFGKKAGLQQVGFPGGDVCHQ